MVGVLAKLMITLFFSPSQFFRIQSGVPLCAWKNTKGRLLLKLPKWKTYVSKWRHWLFQIYKTLITMCG